MWRIISLFTELHYVKNKSLYKENHLTFLPLFFLLWQALPRWYSRYHWHSLIARWFALCPVRHNTISCSSIFPILTFTCFLMFFPDVWPCLLPFSSLLALCYCCLPTGLPGLCFWFCLLEATPLDYYLPFCGLLCVNSTTVTSCLLDYCFVTSATLHASFGLSELCSVCCFRLCVPLIKSHSKEFCPASCIWVPFCRPCHYRVSG